MENRRRAQQLKIAKQKDKEWQKAQSRKDRNGTGQLVNGKERPNIQFANNVVLLEAAARNDIVEVSWVQNNIRRSMRMLFEVVLGGQVQYSLFWV